MHAVLVLKVECELTLPAKVAASHLVLQCVGCHNYVLCYVCIIVQCCTGKAIGTGRGLGGIVHCGKGVLCHSLCKWVSRSHRSSQYQYADVIV
jgi:hypothetical protein